MQAENADGIAGHIDQVDQDRDLQCHLRISHGTKQRRTGIVYCQKRKGEGGYGQVNQRIFHNVRLNTPEKQPQHGFPYQYDDYAKQQAGEDYRI